jgi:CDP-diglyceride synthetase
VAVSSTSHTPNWMLIIICLITALTAIWEAFTVWSSMSLDEWGYLLTGIGMVLFAVQNFIWPRNHAAADRFHLPAVALTLIGIVLLMLSQSDGRRI